jgi:hypothetical protein
MGLLHMPLLAGRDFMMLVLLILNTMSAAIALLMPVCDPLYPPSLLGLSIFHDPGKGGPNQGQATKSLKVTASSAGEGGLLFSLSQAGSSAPKISVSVPVSRNEYVSATLKACRLQLGWTVAAADLDTSFVLLILC